MSTAKPVDYEKSMSSAYNSSEYARITAAPVAASTTDLDVAVYPNCAGEVGKHVFRFTYNPDVDANAEE
jgi:hypothetical protein